MLWSCRQIKCFLRDSHLKRTSHHEVGITSACEAAFLLRGSLHRLNTEHFLHHDALEAPCDGRPSASASAFIIPLPNPPPGELVSKFRLYLWIETLNWFALLCYKMLNSAIERQLLCWVQRKKDTLALLNLISPFREPSLTLPYGAS